MAGELQAPYSTGVTLYALLRNSTGSVWNGSSFVSYATANLSSYAVTMTEQGTASGYYTGAMPAVAAGIYYATVFHRTGGSPAEGDPVVAHGDLPWDGAAVASYANLAKVLGTALTETSSGRLAGRLTGLLDVTSNGFTAATALSTLTAAGAAAAILATPANLLATDASGRVTAGTVSDKTGYSLTQSFPTNFASLAITAAGGVTLADGVAHGGTPGSSTATIAFSRMIGQSQTTDTDCVNLLGNGSGNGVYSRGGATGNGIRGTGGATSGFGIYASAPTGAAFACISSSDYGFLVQGVDGAMGVFVQGGSGPGLQVSGDGTSPDILCSNSGVFSFTAVADLFAQFFSLDSGTTYSSAVDGSVVKEIVTNASGGGSFPANFANLAITPAGGVTLADGVAHGGTPGSSTATYAGSTFRMANPAGGSVTLGGAEGLLVQSTSDWGATFEGVLGGCLAQGTGADTDGFKGQASGTGFGFNGVGGAAGFSSVPNAVGFGAGTVDANLVSIDGQLTSGNNATLNLKQLNCVNNAGPAIVGHSNAGGATYAGMDLQGSGAGDGLRAVGGSGGGSGVGGYANGSTDFGYSMGILGLGNGDSSPGLGVFGGGSNSDAAQVVSTGTGHDIALTGSGGIWDAINSRPVTANVSLIEGADATDTLAAAAVAGLTTYGASTYAGADTSGTTTLLSRLTATRAGYLDNLATAPPSSADVADKLLGRNLAGGSDGGHTVAEALMPLRNKWAIDTVNNALTVYQEDGTTVAWVGSVGVVPGAAPIRGQTPS